MVLEHRAYSEKRGFIRLRVNTPVQVQMGAEHFTAVCKDLSGSGMLMATERALAVGTELDIRIEQEGENRLPFHASAKVARVDEEGDGYIVGLALTTIHD